MNKQFSIGVDLGGTNLRVAAYGAEGVLLETISLKTRLADGRHSVVSDLCTALAALLSRHGASRSCVGIGIGSPGPLELPSGIIRNPPNLPGWDGFNLRHAIESTLGLEISIENDANLAALAEQVLGAGKVSGAESLCMLTMGTGVGSGLILNGQIWHGSSGMGGEAGHVIVEPGGEACGCGGHGCLEQYASATAILRMMSSSSRTPASALQVAEWAAEGDKDALAVFQRVGRSLAIALASIVNLLNLPLYVIGGGASDAWDLFAPAMFQELQARSYIYRLTAPSGKQAKECGVVAENKTQICRARLGSDAGLLGACLFGLQNRSQHAVEQKVETN
jgi:glucokinase